jgi:4-diphosphocytidyl-2-C-methyl-D-erythritol kinase
MNLRQNVSKRIVHAPAKLNLFLEVFDQRDDGFHDLSTLMVPIRLFDSLSFEETKPKDEGRPAIDFSLLARDSAQDVPGDHNNLVVKALELLRQRSGCEAGAKVELVKRIPSAAGLGGGSSDAAAALNIANRAWRIHWEADRLAALAAELGSDVPFFLEPGAAICRGRGERVERLPAFFPLNIVVLKPPTALATADVYRTFDELSADGSQPASPAEHRLAALAAAWRLGDIRQLALWMTNRLQSAAAVLSTWIGQVQAAFAALDFVGHQLSGSGPAYFGICRNAQHARRLAAVLKSRKLGLVFVTRSCC